MFGFFTFTISDLFWMTLSRIVIDIVILVILVYFIYQVWTLIDENRSYTKAAAEDRALANDILKLVKGWTVVHVSAEKERAAEVKEVKQTLQAVPEKTADIVTEKVVGVFTERDKHTTNPGPSGNAIPIVNPPSSQ